MTKKRLAKKTISNVTRCLTDGDTLYENEFVKVPRGKVINSRRVVSARFNYIFLQCFRNTIKLIFSYLQSTDQGQLQTNALSPNINAMTPNSEHSYIMNHATQSPLQQNSHNHKLPSFNEVLTSKNYYQTNGQSTGCQNNNNFTIDNKNNLILNHSSDMKGKGLAPSTLYKSPPGVSDHSYSRYPITRNNEPCPVTCNSTVIIKSSTETASITNAESSTSLVTIPQVATSITQSSQTQSFYLNQNQSSSVQINSSDIMNMDIIFEDMPIEEDRTTQTNIETIPTVSAPSNTGIIDMNNVTYEIISFDEQNPVPVANRTDLNALSNMNGVSQGKFHAEPVPVNQTIQTATSNRSVIIMPESLPANVYYSDTNMSMVRQAAATVSENITVHADDTKQEQKVFVKSAEEAEPVKIAEKKPVLPAKRRNKLLPILVDRNKKPRSMNQSAKGNPTETPKCASLVQSENVINQTNAKEITKPSETATSETNKIEQNQTSNSNVHDQAMTNEVDDVKASTSNPSTSSESGNLMDSLVVVESQDPADPNKTIHEVYVMCPKTKQLSEQPLDLPDEVIQKIRMSMTPSENS